MRKTIDNQIYALIYNRVSSSQQEKEGSGLLSQEQRCIKYAESKGYGIEKTFPDTFTGGGDFMKRPAMRKLLNYIDSNPNRNFVVIFDDLKRFARDTKFHIELRAAFNVRKTAVECLNFKFEDTPEGTFVETILAAQNQLEREQNKRQVIQKQKSRLESGYWAFPAPIGYDMKKMHGYTGKVLVPNAKALLIAEALEGFANLRFTHLTEIAHFLKVNGVFGSNKTEKYIGAVRLLISNPLYAGFIEYAPWQVSRREGHHEAIVSPAIFERNQERLKGPSYITKIMNDRSEDFELRRLISCSNCGNQMTSCFSKGKAKLYPYYLCQTRTCAMKGKSIGRTEMDKMFKELMGEIKPQERLITLFWEWFEQAWANMENKIKNSESVNVKTIETKEAEIQKFIELAGTTTSPIVRQQYEAKIEILGKQLEGLRLQDKVEMDLSFPYRTSLLRILKMAESPYEFWKSSPYSDKKKLFYFYFESNILYDVKTGNRTPNPSTLYRVFDDLAKNSDDVDMVGKLSNTLPALLTFIKQWSEFQN